MLERRKSCKTKVLVLSYDELFHHMNSVLNVPVQQSHKPLLGELLDLVCMFDVSKNKSHYPFPNIEEDRRQ